MCAPDKGEASSSSRSNTQNGNHNNHTLTPPASPSVAMPGTPTSNGSRSSSSSPVMSMLTLSSKMSTTSKSPSLRYIRRSHSMAEASSQMTAGTLVSLMFVVLATYLPFFLSPSASQATYHHASFDYHADISHFDNSIWTYGTDYGLAVAMAYLIWSFPSTTATTTTAKTFSTSHVLTFRAKGMLVCYLLSVLAGGLAHQFYTTAEERGHWSFRFLWTVCVGTVTLASAFMGCIGTELDHLDRESYEYDKDNNQEEPTFSVPSIPGFFWVAYSICSTIVVMMGGFSYQRPACDIFMAGVTQTPSTFYVMALLGMGLKRWTALTQKARLIAIAGFIFNAPLFPLYPLLVQYTDLSLGAINTLLHTWLFIAWTTQGLALRDIAMIVDHYYNNSSTTTTSATRMVQDKKKV